MSGKKFLTSEVWEKNSCPNYTIPTPVPHESQMDNHKGGGEEAGIWHLSSLVPSCPRRFRMLRHLSSLPGKLPEDYRTLFQASSGNSDRANWPRYKAEPAAKFDAPYINISTNICLVFATDVMEHFAFPGNKDFAADDQGAFHVLFMKGLLCLFIVCETMFTIGKSRTISNANDTQAQQVAPNPRGGRFSTEILWSENTDLKFNGSNEEEDGSNKQRNRKNISQWISNAKVILRANWSDFG